MDCIEITINLNIIIGDITGSAVIQGGDHNDVTVLNHGGWNFSPSYDKNMTKGCDRHGKD